MVRAGVRAARARARAWEGGGARPALAPGRPRRGRRGGGPPGPRRRWARPALERSERSDRGGLGGGRGSAGAQTLRKRRRRPRIPPGPHACPLLCRSRNRRRCPPDCPADNRRPPRSPPGSRGPPSSPGLQAPQSRAAPRTACWEAWLPPSARGTTGVEVPEVHAARCACPRLPPAPSEPSPVLARRPRDPLRSLPPERGLPEGRAPRFHGLECPGTAFSQLYPFTVRTP